jgi:cobalt/nickel transport protein
VKTKTFLIVGVLVALLVAGVASFYASSHPDGLLHVADKMGFIDNAEQRDAPLSGGLAGVVGSVTVLVLAGGLAFVLRRRGDSSGARKP